MGRLTDQWLGAADVALRAISGGSQAARPAPTALGDALTPGERRLSGALHLPLLQITDQSGKCNGGDKPLIAGRTWNFLGVEKAAFAVSFDLAF